ncbi:MAG: nuclear transport factor 2 family protein [Balneolaceae bacterium]
MKNVSTLLKNVSPMVLALLLFASCNSESTAPAETVTAEPDPQEVLDREADRVAYLEAQDYDALEELMSPTSTYTHSSGVMDTREQLLNTLRSGDVIYRSLDHHDVQVRIIAPTVAIINGSSDLVVNVQGEDLDVYLRFTLVYTYEDGVWSFEAWHSSPREP